MRTIVCGVYIGILLFREATICSPKKVRSNKHESTLLSPHKPKSANIAYQGLILWGEPYYALTGTP